MLLISQIGLCAKKIIVKGMYIDSQGPNVGPTGETTVKIICAMVSDGVCYEVEGPNPETPVNPIIIQDNEGFESGDQVEIKLNNGTIFSGRINGFMNQPASSGNMLEREHIYNLLP